MEPATTSLGQLVDSSKRIARWLFRIGENRLQLLMIDVQEELEYLLRAVFLALGVALLSLLALLALNAAIVVLLWNSSPVATLLVLAGLYALGAAQLYRRLSRMVREWKIFSATLDQLGKDRECLDNPSP